jgi:hypothetical protein
VGSAAIAAAAALGSACSGTTNTAVTELNLDRPVDVSFACYGQMKLANGQIASANSAMPTAVCQEVAPAEHRSERAVPGAGRNHNGSKLVRVHPPVGVRHGGAHDLAGEPGGLLVRGRVAAAAGQ